MDSVVIMGLKESDLVSLAITVVVAASVSLAVCMICFHWFRREQRRQHGRIVKSLGQSGRNSEELFLTGRDPSSYGELVAQFKVNQGKQVVSVLESEGKRFIHVVGELSAHERTQVVRYLRSEGFMS
jgi:hypothetical protein